MNEFINALGRAEAELLLEALALLPEWRRGDDTFEDRKNSLAEMFQTIADEPDDVHGNLVYWSVRKENTAK